VLSCLDPLAVNSIANGGYGAYTYEWEVNGEFVSDLASINYLADEAGDVTLTITDVCNDSATDEMNFSFPAVPVIVDLGPDFDVTCLDVTVLDAQISGGIGNYAYSWTSAEENFGTNPTANVLVDNQTPITLTVEDQCENVGTDVIVLNVPAVPISLDLGEDLTVTCIEQNTLIPTVSGGVGSYSYSWATQNGVESLDPTYLLQTDEDLVLALDIEDQCGNMASDAITVAVPQVSIQLDLGADLTVGCIDVTPMNPSISGGVGNYNYSWTLNGSVVDLDQNFSLQVENDSYLGLTIEDQCGNTTFDEIAVSVPAVPVYVDLGEDLVVTCIDETVLFPIVSGGVGSYSYQWMYQDLLVGNESTLSFQTPVNAEVVLLIEDECGNSNSDQIGISVPPVPLFISLSVPDTAICIGESIDLEVFSAGGVGQYNYQWIPDYTSLSSFSDNPQINTTYSVLVEDECGNTSQTSVFVGVEDVTPAYMVEYIGDWGIQLNNVSADAVAYEWNFNDGTISNEEHPFHSFENMDPWEVSLTVTGELGCQKTISDIFYPLANLYVPNCFTPDGDGVNEVFKVYGHDILTFEITIFNRFSQIVYTSNDINDVWTGSNTGSEHYVQDGVYTYILKAEGIRGNFIEKMGQVIIVR
jgi:gliding motility-associated-like protein